MLVITDQRFLVNRIGGQAGGERRGGKVNKLWTGCFLSSLVSASCTIGLDLLASIGGIVSCLFLVGACSGFFSLGWALINCQLFSGVLLGVSMLPEPIGSAHVVVVWLWQMNCT